MCIKTRKYVLKCSETDKLFYAKTYLQQQHHLYIDNLGHSLLVFPADSCTYCTDVVELELVECS